MVQLSLKNTFQVNSPWMQPSAAAPLASPTEPSHRRPTAAPLSWAALSPLHYFCLAPAEPILWQRQAIIRRE